MKTQSLLRSLGALLLALLVFVALPSPTAVASNGQCGDVEIYWEYGTGTQIYYELHVYNPSDCVIYVTTSINNPNFPNPSRSGTTPISPTFTVSHGSQIQIPYGFTMYIKAFAYKAGWTQSVNLSYEEQHNPNL
jgi:hypothetical protein